MGGGGGLGGQFPPNEIQMWFISIKFDTSDLKMLLKLHDFSLSFRVLCPLDPHQGP